MSKFQRFIFKNYNFDTGSKLLTLTYSLDDQLYFTETYRFDFAYAYYQPAALERAIQALFFMAGVSYYKTYLPREIVVQHGELDTKTAAFFSKTWQRGLGELFYTNQLDVHTSVNFPFNAAGLTPVPSINAGGLLIGLGGGKDSLVSVELLRTQPKAATWSVGHVSQFEPLVERIGLPHFRVERQWDPQLLELNKQEGVFNGHIPISAILACVGAVVAVLSGQRDIVVSNEASANEPTLTYQGTAINHQYSKSLEFEEDFQEYLQYNFGDSIHYYSVLRPLSEVRIAELFAKDGFEKYKDVFSSCNRAFTHDSREMFWCGECPKCAFVFLALTPFVPREKLQALWHNKNLLLDPALEPTYRQLLGIEGDKPLECVGEIKESRVAMRLAQQIYPELGKYSFELPAEYNYRALAPHRMPADIFALLQQKLTAVS